MKFFKICEYRICEDNELFAFSTSTHLDLNPTDAICNQIWLNYLSKLLLNIDAINNIIAATELRNLLGLNVVPARRLAQAHTIS